MNLLKTGTVCLLFSVCMASKATAQTPSYKKDAEPRKPELFRDLPQRLPLNMSLLSRLLQKETGDTVRVPLADGFILFGVVVSKSPATELRSKTVVIKALNRPGAALTLTGLHKSDGTYQYKSRLLSFKHRDAYELVEEAGAFTFQKKNLDDLVTE